MRLPSISDLTRKQRDVYLYAPMDQHVLVSGPPGTGKTLIACLRAKELQKRKSRLVLAMFNRVLKRYTANAAESGQVPVDTLIRWFGAWWERSGLPPHEHSVILLNVPYDDREVAKDLGARWNPGMFSPFRRKRGCWVVDVDTWEGNRDAFEAWEFKHKAPTDPDDRNGFLLDWESMGQHVLMNDEDLHDAALNLGTLLIDEGQDFSPGLYRLLWRLCAAAATRTGRLSDPPRCFVLADENQQLTSSNSTLEEIRTSLKIKSDHDYVLDENFRNSRQVALLAGAFYADVITGLPLPPDREGEMPQYVVTGSTKEAQDFISRWVRNNPGKEVGVLAFNDAKRQSLYEGLEKSLKSIRGRSQLVQTYSAVNPDHNKSEDLEFDRPDTVTVINVHSCKGLEFDAVFIVDMDDGYFNAATRDRFRMQMFVAVSRAREWVCLLDQVPPGADALHLAELPGPEVLAREDEESFDPDRIARRIVDIGFAPKSLLRQMPAASLTYSSDRRRVAVLLDGRWETNGGAWYEVRDEDVGFEGPGPRPFGAVPPVKNPPHRGPASGSPDRNAGVGAGDDWVARAVQVARRAGAKWADKRPRGGCFWIYGGAELAGELKKLGFKHIQGKGWWRR